MGIATVSFNVPVGGKSLVTYVVIQIKVLLVQQYLHVSFFLYTHTHTHIHNTAIQSFGILGIFRAENRKQSQDISVFSYTAMISLRAKKDREVTHHSVSCSKHAKMNFLYHQEQVF